MKLIFVDRTGSRSIWSIIEAITARLLKEGHQVFFILFDDGNQAYTNSALPEVRSILIQVSPKRHFWDILFQHLVFSRKFKLLLEELKPDVVHTHFAVPSIAARWVAHRSGVPLIISTQHEIYGSMRLHYRLGLRLTERFCSAVTYVSDTVAHSFGQKPDATEKNTRPLHMVIPNGVDVKAIHEATANVETRISGKLVCAGRMMPEKGQDLLLRAFSKITNQFPQVKLVLIGSGPYEAFLKNLTGKLSLEEKVEFSGWLPHDQVLREMASAQIVVVPSDGQQEGYGLVVAEALICNSTLLVSDIPVFHEILDRFPGRGRFFSNGDVNALADGLKDLLTNETRSNLPPLTRQDEAAISSDTMAKSYWKLYQSLIEQSHK